jgi:hypothetical protein
MTAEQPNNNFIVFIEFTNLLMIICFKRIFALTFKTTSGRGFRTYV